MVSSGGERIMCAEQIMIFWGLGMLCPCASTDREREDKLMRRVAALAYTIAERAPVHASKSILEQLAARIRASSCRVLLVELILNGVTSSLFFFGVRASHVYLWSGNLMLSPAYTHFAFANLRRESTFGAFVGCANLLATNGDPVVEPNRSQVHESEVCLHF